MAKKDNNSGPMPKGFFKQFKEKEAFQDSALFTMSGSIAGLLPLYTRQ